MRGPANIDPLSLRALLNGCSYSERLFKISLTARKSDGIHKLAISNRPPVPPAWRPTLPNLRSTNRGGARIRRRYLARRLEILRAAGKEFRVRGVAETGMRDIAAAADLSPANLYNYFRGKHEILFFCQDVSLDRLIVALEKARRLRASASEKLRL